MFGISKIKHSRIFVKLLREWGFSYSRHELVLGDGMVAPYSVFHIGPFELFIVPKVQSII